MRLLFEGGYYSGCGFYSNKYGNYTSKKTSFVITALLCDLFTSIRMAAAHTHVQSK